MVMANPSSAPLLAWAFLPLEFAKLASAFTLRLRVHGQCSAFGAVRLLLCTVEVGVVRSLYTYTDSAVGAVRSLLCTVEIGIVRSLYTYTDSAVGAVQ
jgi:FtsH-binding integral membrane protein